MSIYRYIVWYMKGKREYTKAGYEAVAKYFVSADLDVDCSGKTFMITGGNSGLGYSSALEFAKRKGCVHLVCRNEDLGRKAKDDLIESSENPDINLHIVDMSQPSQIVDFTSKFSQENPSLNVLVNNAGCMVRQRNKTSDGLDVNFATNTLGYYLMTKGLMDLLLRSADPRVIFVSSGGMLNQKLDWDFNFEKMAKYNGVAAYAQNKRQQVVMCEEFAKSHQEIFFGSMHPGWADTPAIKSSMPTFYEKMQGKLRTASQGADTMVWLSIFPAVRQHQSGSFFQDRVPVSKHLPLAWTASSSQESAEFKQKLSQISEKFTSNT